ncbi:MAG: shikimate kinase, partial [Thiohalorhabdaceae bacterium]
MIFLVGPMGSGKSTVGRALAARLGTNLVDLDELVAAGAGLSIPEIFEAEGEAGFRDREQAALADIADLRGPLVVATGGGAVLREANRRRMAEAGRVVYLHAP